MTFDDGVLDVSLRNTAAADEMTLALDATAAEVQSVDGGLRLALTLALGGTPFTQRFGTLGAGVKAVTIAGRAGVDAIHIDDVIAAVEPEGDDTPAGPAVTLSVTGGTGLDTLYGPVDGTTWTLSGAGSGTAAGITDFSGFENLVGGSNVATSTGSDVFTIEAGGSVLGTIDGAGGLDMLIGPARTNDWFVTGADAGHAQRLHELDRDRVPPGRHGRRHASGSRPRARSAARSTAASTSRPRRTTRPRPTTR